MGKTYPKEVFKVHATTCCRNNFSSLICSEEIKKLMLDHLVKKLSYQIPNLYLFKMEYKDYSYSFYVYMVIIPNLILLTY